jgi:hypothetical protein
VRWVPLVAVGLMNMAQGLLQPLWWTTSLQRRHLLSHKTNDWQAAAPDKMPMMR